MVFFFLLACGLNTLRGGTSREAVSCRGDKGSVLPYGEEFCRASGLCGASAAEEEEEEEEGRRHVVSGTTEDKGRMTAEKDNNSFTEHQLLHRKICSTDISSSPLLIRVMYTPKLLYIWFIDAFQSKMKIFWWFQVHKCENLLIFVVLHCRKLNTECWYIYKITGRLINDENKRS